MSREAHVRFCEGRGVRSPPATLLPAGDAPCVVSRSFCYGAILDIAGTGMLSPFLGSTLPAGRFPFNLHMVDEDTGVALRDSDVIRLTISLPGGPPYVATWDCFPLHGTTLGGCSLEVTGHG
jgi:hypothetical protein